METVIRAGWNQSALTRDSFFYPLHGSDLYKSKSRSIREGHPASGTIIRAVYELF